MENTEQTQEQLSALLQVRRDKLTELQNDGRDPFKITKFERTHTSAQLKENYTEEDRELKKRGSDEVQIIKAQVSVQRVKFSHLRQVKFREEPKKSLYFQNHFFRFRKSSTV